MKHDQTVPLPTVINSVELDVTTVSSSFPGLDMLQIARDNVHSTIDDMFDMIFRLSWWRARKK